LRVGPFARSISGCSFLGSAHCRCRISCPPRQQQPPFSSIGRREHFPPAAAAAVATAALPNDQITSELGVIYVPIPPAAQLLQLMIRRKRSPRCKSNRENPPPLLLSASRSSSSNEQNPMCILVGPLIAQWPATA
jgi:hypothetical protein